MAVASRWRHCADLTGSGIETQISRTKSVGLAIELTAGVAHMLMLSKMLFRAIKYYNFTCSQFTSMPTMECTVQYSKRKETTKKIETRKKENSSWY